jgi:hypothetical protein
MVCLGQFIIVNSDGSGGWGLVTVTRVMMTSGRGDLCISVETLLYNFLRNHDGRRQTRCAASSAL